ncbi:hypothetical protein JVU11DRAFT_11345 [Chiua virens]|nr:hypothetical protein JVU11DRAFT_11345 [Chiua virens]
MRLETRIQIIHLTVLFLAGLGQTLLFCFAWGFFGVVWEYEALHLPFRIVHLLTIWPSEVTMVVTLIGTVLSLLTTSFFALAFKEALRHRMHKPISFIKLECVIALARGGLLITQNIPVTLVTLAMFGLTKLMVSSWSTLLTPTLVAKNITVNGIELDLNSNYFESQLYEQLLNAKIATVTESNSLKIIDTEGLLSGIASAQLNFGIEGAVSFNGVSYNVTTGGVVPVVPGYLGTGQIAQSNNTRLGFVGGLVPSNLSPAPTASLSSNYSIFQQGLTAQVTCTQVSQPGLVTTDSGSTRIPVSNGAAISLTVYAFQMGCDEGIPAQQSYVIRSNDDQAALSSSGVVYSLVCPSPVNQSQQLDFTRFNVTSGGAVTAKYAFLQSTTCEIIPRLTTSLVSYVNKTLVVNVINSTTLTPSNSNLSLYLASIIEYQALNSQGLTSNTFGDALYSVAVTSDTNLTTSGPMDPNFLSEMEQYWRGVIEFVGTYLRSGFSAAPINTDIPPEGQSQYSGVQTITTIGWAKRSPIYLYTVLPVTIFLILTYAAIIYVLYELTREGGYKFTTFDPTNPLHLIMVSSTRGPLPDGGSSKGTSDERHPVLNQGSGKNLEGEKLGDFSRMGIQYNHTVTVELADVVGQDSEGLEAMRKHFKNVTENDFETYKAECLKSSRRCCQCGPRRPATNTKNASHEP